jgi:hypothetical protein
MFTTMAHIEILLPSNRAPVWLGEDLPNQFLFLTARSDSFDLQRGGLLVLPENFLIG